MAAARRWGPWALLAVVVVVAAVIGFQPSSHPTPAQRAASIGARVRCPECEGQNVNQSDTATSSAIKADIRTQVDAGRTSQQILDSIVGSYGPGILERPPASGVNLLVWLVPILAVAAAAVGLVVAFRRWGRSGSSAVASSEDRRLVDDALGGSS